MKSSDLGEEVFFQTLKVDVFLGYSTKKFLGRILGRFWGISFFFTQKWDFGSSLKVEDL